MRFPRPFSSRWGDERLARHASRWRTIDAAKPVACLFLARIGLMAVAAATAMAGLAGAVGTDTPITAKWSGIGLREWADRVSELAHVPVIVDRRLDPDTAIAFDCQAVPLGDLLAQAATLARGELAVVRSSIRIVPPGKAAALSRAETARNAQLATLPPRQRAQLAERRPWTWAAGACPSDLVAASAAEAGVVMQDSDRIPHDHLPATTLPPLTLAERLDLVLAGYDLRIDWQGDHNRDPKRATGRIVAIEHGLATKTPRRPDAEKTTDHSPGKRTAVVSKPIGDQQPAAGGDTFSLRVAAPLQEVLVVISARLKLRLDIDRDSLQRRGIALAEIVRVTVKDVTREQLLTAILDPLKLEWTIRDGTLHVFAPVEAAAE